MILGYEKLF